LLFGGIWQCAVVPGEKSPRARRVVTMILSIDAEAALVNLAAPL
jgi:hypothetical protein